MNRSLNKTLSNVLVASIAMVAASLPRAGQAADDAQELLKFVPGSTNAVAVLRIQDIVRSPRGEREQWGKKPDEVILAGAEHVPEGVTMLVRAAHIVPDDSARGWQASVMLWAHAVSMKQIAESEKSEIETIATVPAVFTRRNGYFVRLAPHVLGSISPADRQDVARWIRLSRNASSAPLSTYLQDAIESSRAHIVLALDTEDMLDPRFIKTRLAGSKAISPNLVDVDALANWLAGLRGIRFHATFADDTDAELRFDFASIAGARLSLLKPLLLELMEDRGSAIDDLEASDVTAENNSVVMRMKLSDSGLRQIMTLLSSAPPAPQTSPGETSQSYDEYLQLQASQRYYKSIMQILDDLERLNRRANNYLKTATWHENFAKKIAQLPILGVDPQLVEFGHNVSEKLRALAASLRGVPLKVNALERSITYNFNTGRVAVYYDDWGYGFVPSGGYWQGTTNLPQIREQQAEAVTKGAQERTDIWNMLQSERYQIRAAMTEKYKTDFDKVKK